MQMLFGAQVAVAKEVEDTVDMGFEQKFTHSSTELIVIS